MARNPLPPLPSIKASVPMKAVFWSNVPAQKLKESVWLKKELVQHLGDIQLDTEELENLFAAKKTEQKEQVTKKVVERITLIDPKKAQNAAIILGSMRLPYKEVRKAILQLDENKLAAENIKALKDLAPTADELEAVKNFQGDVNLLGPTEQFYREIIDIPRLDQRLGTWLFKLKFPNSISTIQPDIEAVTAVCKELQESPKFMKLLEVVLAIGNFLNSGRKGAHGFQLSSLMKLKDTKATGAKLDLLDYIILFLEKKFPDAVNFFEELAHVEPATRVAIQNIQTELNELKVGVNQVANEIEVQGDGCDAADNYRVVMIEFLDFASEKMEELEVLFRDMNKAIEQLAVFFAEDEKKFKPEQFINDLKEFVNSFKFAHSEILRKREAEQKKLEREQKKNAKTTDSSDNVSLKNRKREKTVLKKTDSEGLLEATLESLADGSGFKKTKKAKKLKGTNLDVDDVMLKLKSKEGSVENAAKKKAKKKLLDDDLD
jgi:hypothetical protein